MNRHLITSLIACFVLTQALSFGHMAEHDFASHEHDGKICSVYLLSKTSDASAAEFAALAPVFTLFQAQPAILEQAVYPRNSYTLFSSRAPPTYS
ncbi:MAG: hypothetical protein K6L76_06775 [Agarilytica sp.]